jgi:hypothetical protein
MSRKLMIVLLSSTLVLSNMSTSAWAAADVSVGQTVQTGDPVKNQAPLPPAGAAGIKQAQGFVEEYPLLTIALVAGLIAVVWILLDEDDDDNEVPTTGT